MALTLDDHHLLYEGLESAINTFRPYYHEIQSAKRTDALGFTELPYQSPGTLKAIADLAAEVRATVKDVVVIGIGGSDLGARAVHRALNHQFYNLDEKFRKECPRLFFAGDTTDPVALQEIIEAVNWGEAALVVISKSGDTVEQMSTFFALRHLPKTIIVVTDAEKGTLRQMARDEGYKSLVIPTSVGGRFSVLSSVGLFPLAIVGVDIQEILRGARELDAYDSQKGPTENMIFKYAIFQHLAYTAGCHISVMMPYVYSLSGFSLWFRQLWAESLGKELRGPTPIAAMGPTDQHSQIQLYREGPNNKIVTFIKVKKSGVDVAVPENIEGPLAYLGSHTFDTIVGAECEATALALTEAGRSSLALTLDNLDAYHMGQLLYFYELAVVYLGNFFEVNPFDQPGVELGKKYLKDILTKDL
jgi:glucose-6-phosphate isomerase